MGYRGQETPVTPVGPDVLDAGDVAYDPLAAGLEGVPGCSQLVDLLRKLPIRHPQVTDTETMPKLVVGYTELGCSKLKRGKGFSKPNFEPVPSSLAVEPHVREGKFFAQPSIRITGRREGWCRGGSHHSSCSR